MKPAALSLAILLPALSFDLSAQEFDQKAAAQEAKGIVQAYGKALKTELITAMKNGGPANALEVCNLQAIPITEQKAAEMNAQISRVSLKNRNPDNAPNDWQRAILEEFDARAAAGEEIAPMASVSIVESDGKKQLRFMKAVPTEGACLACHGAQLSEDVRAGLKEMYPDDKATGYNIGEVRGAIVVVKDYK